MELVRLSSGEGMSRLTVAAIVPITEDESDFDPSLSDSIDIVNRNFEGISRHAKERIDYLRRTYAVVKGHTEFFLDPFLVHEPYVIFRRENREFISRNVKSVSLV